MLLRRFFYSLSLYLAVPALSIPKYDNQLPLVQEHKLSQSQSTDVVLAFKERGSNAVHQIEIPLRTKVFPSMSRATSFIPTDADNLTRHSLTESTQRYTSHGSHRTRPVGITREAGKNYMWSHTEYQHRGKRSIRCQHGTKGIAMVCSKRWSCRIRKKWLQMVPRR